MQDSQTVQTSCIGFDLFLRCQRRLVCFGHSGTNSPILVFIYKKGTSSSLEIGLTMQYLDIYLWVLGTKDFSTESGDDAG